VQPHYRSAPDGNFYNNWSTKGNVNPYTGVPGTRVTPPANYGGSVFPSTSGIETDWESSAKKRALNEMESLGWTLKNPDAVSWTDVNDAVSRIKKANDVKRLGVDVDWQKHGFSELYDFEFRIKKAQDLKSLGLDYDWRKHSFSDLYDVEVRYKKAGDLKRLGYDFDWKQWSFSDMYDAETRINKARQLKQLGLDVDWRKHSFSELYSLELDVRTKRRN